MRQELLFGEEETPRAPRKTSGMVVRLQQFAAAAVLVHPGRTGCELAALVEQDPRVINRRLCEIEKAGLAVRGEKRVCNVTGRVCLTWWPKGTK